METQKTITVTVPASEPQTTTKEINVPSYWKMGSFGSYTDYLLVLSPQIIINIIKFSRGTYNVVQYIPSEFNMISFNMFEECPKDEAEQVFREMQKGHNDLVFGDQQEQFDQAIQSYTEQNFVTDKPIIERKHTEFE